MSLTKIRKSNIEPNVQLPHANAAFDTANSSGVYANAAFAVANSAAAGSVDSYARDTANSASSYANGAFAAANNAVDTWVRDAANSASSYANGAFSGANTANTLAQAAYDAANNAVDTWVRDAANSASSYANSGYNQANTTNTLAQASFDSSNSASSYANSAYAHANTRLSSSGGTVDGDLSITGNLVISGNTTTVDVETLRITDPIILLANNNTTDLVDIGFTAHYGATEKHTGLLRHAPTQEYYLFDNYDGHILHQNNSVDISNSDFRIVTLNANLKSNTVVVRGVEVLDRVNSSYSTANVAGVYANAAFEAANTPSNVANSSSSYANGAFVSANTADQKSVSAGDYANSGYAQANTANTNSTQADQRAVTSGTYANAAYGHANTANTLAQAAYDAANNATDSWVRDASNSASSYANSSYIHANAAFEAANAGGGGSGTDEFARDTANAAFDVANTISSLQNNSFTVSVVHDNFIADGDANTFTLSTEPIDKNYTIVTFDGVVQHKSVYNVSTTILSFDSPPTVNTEIDVTSFGRVPGNFAVSVIHNNFISDGSNTSFTLSATPENENYTLVTINGVVQHKDAYSVSGSILTLSEAPLINSSIDIVTFTGISAEYSNVSSNIIPSVTETYDLGSSDKKWKDLYLSGNTIFLGNTTISSSNNDLVLPTNTKIGTGGTTLPTSGGFNFRNKIINGNFDIWQRGASQTSSGYDSADRWASFNVGSTKTASRQSFTLGQTDVPGEPSFFMRHVVTSVAGAGNNTTLVQRLESVRTLAGKTATLSFWAKADSSKNIAIEFAQVFGTGGSPSDSINKIGSQLVALTTSWTKYTITVEIPSISSKTIGTNNNDFLQMVFWFDAGSNFDDRTDSLGQQSGTFDIAQVQLEEGAVATPFEQRPLDIEQQLCYRYYQFWGSANATNVLSIVYMINATSARWQIPLMVPLRTTPSIVNVSAPDFVPTIRYQNSGLTGYNTFNVTSFPSIGLKVTSVGFQVTVTTAGFIGGIGMLVTAANLYFDAEL